MRAVLGVDGCPGGWVGALVDQAGALSWHAGGFAELLALPVDLVAVDIPVGLPDGASRRAADAATARALGAQRSSVFWAPPRAVLSADSHEQASALSRAAGSTGVSLQTWNILPKIAEVDALPDPRVVEVHPELSFRRLSGGLPLARKVRVQGREQRLALLRTWLPQAAVPAPRPGRAKPDDCVDALVCAWTGWRVLRGEADSLGDDLAAIRV